MSFSKSNLFQKIESDEDFQNERIKRAILVLGQRNNTSQNQEALFSFPEHADKIAVGLNTLKEYEALTEQNRLRICTHAELANEIARAITMLHRSNIYTLSNWLLIANEPEHANAIAASFEFLEKSDIFTEKNKKDICSIHTNLDKSDSIKFGNALAYLFYRGILTQESFDKLSANPKNSWQIIKDLESNVSRRNVK